MLAQELRALGLEPSAPEEGGPRRGAVAFRGSWPAVWRSNLELRTANRVLVELGTFPASDDELLYREVRRIVESPRQWDGVPAVELFHPRRSVAVRATSRRSAIRDTRWLALKVKDAVVDAQRRRFGRRSNVDREEADLPLRLFLEDDRATLLLDTSGTPLDRRGYRVSTIEAPLRENLAAACVLASGWTGGGAVLDPMCGSGTLLIEAAWLAQRRAPGLLRKGRLFERLPGFERAGYEALCHELEARIGPAPSLFGRDQSANPISATRDNLAAAGLAGAASLSQGDAFAWEPVAEPGLVLVNPPYGERLEGKPDDWRRVGDWLKRLPGWTAVVLAGDETLGKHIGLRPRARLPVWNGPIEARILVFDLY
jgi:putative N6-adenine-specific DNA methylase